MRSKDYKYLKTILKFGVGFNVNHVNKEGKTPMRIQIERLIDGHGEFTRDPIFMTLAEAGAKADF